MLKKVYSFLLTLWFIYRTTEPARVRPTPISAQLFNATCIENASRLSNREYKLCNEFSGSSESVLLDFVAPICGYKSNCAHDPAPIPDCCPLAVESGVLSDALLNETLSHVIIGGPWQRMRPVLECLKTQPQLAGLVKSMDVEFQRSLSEFQWTHLSEYDYPPASVSFIAETSSVFLDTLQIMSNLQNLTVNIPSLPHHGTTFMEAMDRRNISSLSIQHLRLGMYTHSLIAHCPQLQSAKMHDWRYLDDDGASFKGFLDSLTNTDVREVEVMKHYIDKKDLQNLLGAVPAVRILSFRLRLQIEKSIPSLRSFTQLEELVLPFASELGLGFDPPGCGNMYMDDPTLSDRVNAVARGYEKMVAEMICKGLPTVKTLGLTGYRGGYRYDLTNEECTAWRKSCDGQEDCYKNITRFLAEDF